tara:strand:+ start:600 stop:1016 length:417 start_codon:yes stop_codon:yes gene_type:complete
MRLYNTNGKLQYKNVTKYLIDWNKKSKSKLQFKVKEYLKKYWKNQIVYEEFPVYGTRMRVDMLNATKKIAIEVQGAQHSSFNKFFHNNSRAKYLSSIKRDWEKAKWLERNGFKLVEIEEEEANVLSKKLFREKFKVNL